MLAATNHANHLLPITLRAHLQSPAIYPIVGHATRYFAHKYRLSTLAHDAPVTASPTTSSSSPTATTTAMKAPTLFRSVPSLFNDFDEVFHSPFFSNFETTAFPKHHNWLDRAGDNSHFFPKYNVHSDDEKVSLALDVPGVKPDDVIVEVKDDKVLHISGERKHTKDDGSLSEIKFDKEFTLGDPAQVDTSKIIADLADGVLRVILPKLPRPPENVRKIGITANGVGTV
mmetsp:Transcript_10084/g.14798  ORF Transcript_10084/g.14798 Transcript_10084/m.14798 type:complete len:229 (-) Transcript_10084:350-1036(-)